MHVRPERWIDRASQPDPHTPLALQYHSLGIAFTRASAMSMHDTVAAAAHYIWPVPLLTLQCTSIHMRLAVRINRHAVRKFPSAVLRALHQSV
jgi:hypothetical protein